jgi:hypothetical protein
VVLVNSRSSINELILVEHYIALKFSIIDVKQLGFGGMQYISVCNRNFETHSTLHDFQ